MGGSKRRARWFCEQASKKHRSRSNRKRGHSIAGTLNFKNQYAPSFPLVEMIKTNPGKVLTVAELEDCGLVRALEKSCTPDQRCSPREWPSYERCVDGAPLVHQGDRPDISRADFTWCRTAIRWGWSVKETASRLMEFSSKARENGQRYALRTATRAAGLH